MLQQAYGEDCLSRTQCHEWYQRFKSGRTSIEDDPKSGWPSTSMGDDHVEKVLAVIHHNHRPTVGEVAEEVGIYKSSCHLILTNKLQMRCVATKFMLHLLTDAHPIRGFLTKHETTVVPLPPYSPDLAPADFFLFPKLKSSLKVRRFQTAEEIEENLIRDLRAFPQNTLQSWKKCWERCTKSGGEYCEGDKFDKVVSKAKKLKKKKVRFLYGLPSYMWRTCAPKYIRKLLQYNSCQ